MNAVRVTLVMAANGAVLCFIAAGRVVWGAALLLAGAAVVGSYGGARLARRADVAILRAGVIALGAAMTAVPFARALGLRRHDPDPRNPCHPPI